MNAKLVGELVMMHDAIRSGDASAGVKILEGMLKEHIGEQWPEYCVFKPLFPEPKAA